MLDGMRRAVERNTAELVGVAASEGTPDAGRTRMALKRAILDQQEQLRQDFSNATRLGRNQSRLLSHGQVAGELAAIQGWLRRAKSPDTVPQPLDTSLDLELAAEDEAESLIAGASMAAAWGTMALGAVNGWRDRGNRRRELLPSLRQLSRRTDARVKRHAASQAVDAYSLEHRAAWPSLRAPDVTRRLRGISARAMQLPPALDLGPPATEQGLPHGWEAGVFDVWTAVLDGVTCPVCWKLDGQMIPQGKDFDPNVRPYVHPNCRCEVITAFIPEAVRARLPGMQIDYQHLKDDVREFFQGAQPGQMGIRHAKGFIRDTQAMSGSPEALTRRQLDRSAYLAVKKRLKAPPLLADTRRAGPPGP